MGSGCSGTPTPTTPAATCDGDTVAGPDSWAPWQVTASITADSTDGPAGAVPSVEAFPSVPYSDDHGDDPAARRVWRCDGYTMLALVLTSTDQLSGPTSSTTLPRTPCAGERITAADGEGALTLVERTSWCAEDLGGGSEPGFDGWWVDVTAAQTGTYTWARDVTWTLSPVEETASATSPRTPVTRSGRVSVTAVLAP